MSTVSELILKPAVGADLDRVLIVLGVDPTGMSFIRKRDAVVSNFHDLAGWYFNEMIYKFQIEEIIKIIMTGQQMVIDRAEYLEWVDMHNKARAEALSAAEAQGFTYSYTGKLIETSTGTITGVVASPAARAETITLSVTGDADMMRRGRNAVIVNELISEAQTANGTGYEMNFNGVDDPVFTVGKYTDGFNWGYDSPYDYIFLYSETYGKIVPFSDLSVSDIGTYMQERWYRKVVFSDAVATYKEKYIHGRLSASRRLNAKSKELMLQMKDYITLMGDVEVDG